MACVLVVEDRAEVLSMVSRALRRAGVEVVEATSASEASRAWEGCEPRPDALITDYHLPGESGADLARKLWAEREDLPVLVISGKGGGEVATFVAETPASFLPKPFQLEVFLNAVRQLVAF